MTTAPKLEPCPEKALEEALCNYTNWVEDFGRITDPDHARVFTALCDAYEAWHRRAAPSAGLREDNALTPRIERKVTDDERDALIERCAKIAESMPICPFSNGQPDPGLEPSEPCPICGDLGTFDAETSSKCGTAAHAIRQLKTPSKDRGDSAPLTLSKEGGDSLSPHQTIARDE